MRGFALALVSLLSLAPPAHAQDRVPADSARPTITVPAGTPLRTLLERALTRRTGRAGNPIYLQLDHPVVVHDTVAMPAGTYLEGVLDDVSTSARGQRSHLRLRLTRLVYPNGYVLAQERAAEGRTGEDLPNLPGKAASAVFLGTATVGTGLIALGGAGSGAPRTALLAPVIGFGLLGLVALITPSSFSLDEGTPVELLLREPLVLDARRATAPGAAALLPRPRRPTRQEELCYDPGTPGTSDTVLPGTPGTPDVVIPGAPGTPDVVIPGIPATPPTVIPGMPGTPGSWSPCRR